MKSIVEPAVAPDGVPACLSSAIERGASMTTSTLSVAVTGAPVGGVPATVAVLSTTSASTSAWVSVYVAVQVVEAPGASVVTGQVTVPTLAS